MFLFSPARLESVCSCRHSSQMVSNSLLSQSRWHPPSLELTATRYEFLQFQKLCGASAAHNGVFTLLRRSAQFPILPGVKESEYINDKDVRKSRPSCTYS